MALSSVYINDERTGVEMVIQNPDGTTSRYQYSGRVSASISQGSEGSLSLYINVLPTKGESRPPLSPPNAYKG